MSSITGTSYVRRMRTAVSGSSPITISATSDFKPVDNSSVFAVDVSNNICICSSEYVNTDDLSITITDNGAGIDFVYYDAVVTSTQEDGMQELDVYVNTTYNHAGFGGASANKASLGIPNAIQLLEVIDGQSTPQDVTGKFRLVNNQKDHFYDHSFITLKAGETLVNNVLRVKVKVLRRQSTQGSGYLTVNSYSGLTNPNLIKSYVGKDGIEYNLFNAFDFRP